MHTPYIFFQPKTPFQNKNLLRSKSVGTEMVFSKFQQSLLLLSSNSFFFFLLDDVHEALGRKWEQVIYLFITTVVILTFQGGHFPGWVFFFEMSGSPRHSTSQQLLENQSPRTPGKLEPSQSSLKCIEEIFLLILGKEPIPHTWLMSVHPTKIPSRIPMLPMLKKLASTATNIPSPWTYDLIDQNSVGQSFLWWNFTNIYPSQHQTFELFPHQTPGKNNSTHPPPKKAETAQGQNQCFFLFLL